MNVLQIQKPEGWIIAGINYKDYARLVNVYSSSPPTKNFTTLLLLAREVKLSLNFLLGDGGGCVKLGELPSEHEMPLEIGGE